MANAAERDPLKHLFVVCTAILAVLLNAIVLVVGGVFMLASSIAFSSSGTGELIIGCSMSMGTLGLGIVNILIMAHVFGQRDRAKPRAFKVAGVLNGLLIALAAVTLFSGAGLFASGLVFVLAASTLAAIFVGRTKPIPAGHCQTCGYDLAGLERGVCPECGN